MVEKTGWKFEGCNGNTPRDGISIVISDLVQWLDIFYAIMY